MEKKNKAVTYYRRVSYGFKIATVLLLFFLTSFRLILLFYFPNAVIIPDKVLLFIILAIVLYLWVQELRDFYNLLALNKDLRDAHEQLKRAEIDTIASLVKAEEEKDLYTCGHSGRVTEISLAIAEEMNLDEEAKKIIWRAGILHDIGKIGISDAILNKKERLTEEEWKVIKSHSEKGYKILEPLKFLEFERDVILSHHERCDGAGYPDGRREAQIRREALIIAVADAFDAMNSKRAYREPLSRATIISELTVSRGTQHSKEIVDVLLRLLEKNPRLWEEINFNLEQLR